MLQRPHRIRLQRLVGTVQLWTQRGPVLLTLSVPTCRGCNSEISTRGTRFLCQPDHAATDGALVIHHGEGSRKSARVCLCRPRSRLWCRPELHTEKTRPFHCPSKKRLLKQLEVRLRQLAVGRQAAETSRRRVVEAGKKSAEALRKAQRESDEVLDNLLKSVEDFDKPPPCAKAASCWERMGGFATSARRRDRWTTRLTPSPRQDEARR